VALIVDADPRAGLVAPGSGIVGYGGSVTAAEPTQGDLVVLDAPGLGRYEARVGEELAGFVTYRRLRGRIAFLHTETLPAFAGRGVATAIAQHVLDEARVAGLGVTPICPFIAGYIERHPAYRDLVTWGRSADGSADAATDRPADGG
jgi:predicted GNAT family acetyltransferase